MTSNEIPKDLHELMLLYAADAIDPVDSQAVEEWLASGDPEARAALEEARLVVMSLLESLEPVTPPAEMWERLELKMLKTSKASSNKQTVKSEATKPARTDRPAPSNHNVANSVPSRPRVSVLSDSTKPVTGETAGSRLTRFPYWRSAVLAASVAAALSVGSYLLSRATFDSKLARFDEAQSELLLKQQAAVEQQCGVLIEQSQQLTEQAEALTQQTQSISGTINVIQQALGEQEKRLAEQSVLIQSMEGRIRASDQTIRLVSAPGVQTVEVAGTKEMPGAVGKLLWDAEAKSLTFSANNLQALPAGKTYELWFVTDPAGPVSLGTFKLETGEGENAGENAGISVGRAIISTRAPLNLTGIQAVAVSLEPISDVARTGPTGPIVMLAKMQ